MNCDHNIDTIVSSIRPFKKLSNLLVTDHVSSTFHSTAMAPSRALLPLHGSISNSVQHHLRASPCPRLPSTSRSARHISSLRRISSLQAPHRLHPPALQAASPRYFPAISNPRSYATAPPQPPDYLNERELHIFNKISKELEPVKLEVWKYPCRDNVVRRMNQG